MASQFEQIEELQVVRGMSNYDYHAERDHESSSTIKAFIADPELYYYVRIKRTAKPEPVGYSASIGTAVHTLVFEPERWASDIGVGPAGASDRTNAFRDFAASLPPDMTAITHADRDRVMRMADSVRANPAARELLDAACEREVSLFWNEPLTSVPLKVRFDQMNSDGVFWDLKTTADAYPEGFRKSVHNFGYHVSQALYRMARDLWRPGQSRQPFYLVAVGNEFPYSCHVYQLQKSAVDYGESVLMAALHRLDAMRSFHIDEPWKSPLWGRINKIDLPGWAYSNVNEVR